jgi:3-oxoacid CoA-transferase subunit A
VFRKTARNFNVPAAHLRQGLRGGGRGDRRPGQLDPDAIHLPGVYVQRLICGAPYDKKIEFRTTRTTDAG